VPGWLVARVCHRLAVSNPGDTLFFNRQLPCRPQCCGRRTWTAGRPDWLVPRRLVGIGYAARFPKKVRRLVLVGAPIDIAAAESQLSRFVADVPLRMFDELVRQGEGIVYGDRTLESWGISSGFNEAEAVLQNPPDLDSALGRELCDRFRQWYAETLNLPGVFYLQVVKWLFKENQIAERRFVALGQQVDLTRLRAPIFLLAASNDEVVSVDQLFATASRHTGRIVGEDHGTMRPFEPIPGVQRP